MRRYRTESEPEPWIEQLIQNYGKEQRGTSVRAHVVGVSDLTESQRTDVSDACMLFLSDGTVFIPAVLSAAAWEHMQELEERDTFSGLDNTTVSVRKFQLNFHMDPELVHTMLPSVRQQILMTWRSLMKESSVTSMSSQSGFPLSCLMGAWHNDIFMDLLNDAMQKIAAPSAGHLGMAPPTHWHRERLRCRGEECFSTPVSHLLIPEEQREMLTADPGVSSSSETPSGPVPLRVAEPTKRPITAQDRGRDSSALASDRLEDGHQLTLNNTKAGSVQLDCEPFPHCVIRNFVQNESFVENLRDELLQLNFHSKSNDLYKFQQSDDLKKRKEHHISQIRSLLFNQFSSWLSKMLAVDLETTVDISCAKYEHTDEECNLCFMSFIFPSSADVLLCHDDELEGRRVAFILYLVPPWDLSDGGTLDLYNTDVFNCGGN
ncbi:hypothetical protein QTP86_030355 [Hemibagrus guttatus]|nr:hypothetical protein QTP86_030355 [Hemibagrus guttatus]